MCSFAAWKQNNYVYLREEADAPVLMHVFVLISKNGYIHQILSEKKVIYGFLNYYFIAGSKVTYSHIFRIDN